MKILFIGCVKGSEELLKTLITKNFNIVGVITKRQSNFNSDFCDLSYCAKENNIDYFYTKDINDIETLEYIKSKNPDIIYCFGWSQLLKTDVLSIPKIGVVGFHPAELPFNRGRHPIIWALCLGLSKTASTFFIMNEGADTGDIVSQKLIDIEYKDTANTLYKKVIDLAKCQVIDFTNNFINGKQIIIKQDMTLGNVWRKRTQDDGKIDWRMSSRAIYNLVRGLTRPYIGAHFIYDNKEIKVWKVEEILTDEYKNIESGKVLKCYDGNIVDIKAYDNVIRIIDADEIYLKEGEYLF